MDDVRVGLDQILPPSRTKKSDYGKFEEATALPGTSFRSEEHFSFRGGAGPLDGADEPTAGNTSVAGVGSLPRGPRRIHDDARRPNTVVRRQAQMEASMRYTIDGCRPRQAGGPTRVFPGEGRRSVHGRIWADRVGVHALVRIRHWVLF